MAIFIGRRPEVGFTRVPNDWARDPKLTTKAKGLLTYLLSHQDGYRLTVQQVIAENADGRDAIYKTLAELVEHGYLRREQTRGERGKVGEVNYYVADSPQVTTASGFTASGESGSGDDQGKQDVSAGGTASWNAVSGVAVSGKPDTKKTKEKKTKVLEDQNTISLSGLADDAAAASVPAQRTEREIEEALQKNQTDNPIHRLLLDASCPSERLTEAERWITEECQPRGLGWWRKTGDNGDLKVHVAAFLEAGPSTSCRDCNDSGQTGDWMNPRPCDCIWWKDPAAARKAFVAQLKDFPPCDHGVAGGDMTAPNGWRHCAQCRGPGWADPNVQTASDGFRAMFNRSPADRVVRDAQPLYAKYKAQENSYKPYRDPTDMSVYHDDWQAPRRTT